jgi:hypothetical protein
MTVHKASTMRCGADPGNKHNVYVLDGPVRNPPPMNPASKVWPLHNPNVLVLHSGAWANRNGEF